MKRYLIFSYNNYYPCGGMQDFLTDIDDLSLLESILINIQEDFLQVYDSLEKRFLIEEIYVKDYIKKIN